MLNYDAVVCGSRIALAMELEHPHHWGDGHADLRPDVAHLEYGAIKRGYAWIFPKADHLNLKKPLG